MKKVKITFKLNKLQKPKTKKKKTQTNKQKQNKKTKQKQNKNKKQNKTKQRKKNKYISHQILHVHCRAELLIVGWRSKVVNIGAAIKAKRA